MQRPSVGRIVHYVSHGTPPRADGTQAYRSECRAAIVTAVPVLSPGNQAQAEAEHWPIEVSLCVLNPTGLFFHETVPHHGGDPDHVDATPIGRLTRAALGTGPSVSDG